MALPLRPQAQGSERPSLFHHLVRPPKLRTLESRERKATWLELFFDLTFVVALSKLTHALIDFPTWEVAGWLIGLFIPVWVAWQSYTVYADRFDTHDETDDLVFRGTVFYGMLCVLAMAVQIPEVIKGYSTGFTLAYMALRLGPLLLNLWAYHHVPQARPLVGRYALGYSLSIVLWGLSLLFDNELKYLFWALGLLVDLAIPLFNLNLTRHLPLHVSHIAERFGLFTIIVMGELVLGVATGIESEDWQAGSSLVAGLAFVLTTLLWWIYFHAGSRFTLKSGLLGGTFTYIHLPLLCALAFVSAGTSLLIKKATSDAPSSEAVWLTALGGAVYLFCTTVAQNSTHIGVTRTLAGARVLGMVALLGWAGLGGGSSPLVYLIGVVLIFVVLAFIDARERFFYEVAHPLEGEQERHHEAQDQRDGA